MLRRAGLIVSVSAILLFLGTGSAQALSLVTITPSAGAVLTHSPTQVLLTFDSPLGEQGNSITVTDPSGKRIDDGSLEVSGSKALVGITTLSSTGVMTIDYQVVSTDGLALSGSSKFQIDAAALATPSAAASATPTPVDTLPPLESSTATNSFWSNLKSGGVGILLGVLLLTVLLSRLARRKRR
ncbi:MAG: copper resistance CopC family protein [Actinomycetes bacterium]